MNIIDTIQDGVVAAVKALYGEEISKADITMNTTRKEFEGDYTIVVFPFTRFAKKKPEEIAQEIGQHLSDHIKYLSGFNIIKGFLNLTVSDAYWQEFLLDVCGQTDYGRQPRNGHKVLVEFSSPNTNKPLHLGHIRNNLLGWATYKILDACGYEVVRVQIVNDRGIAICKSMLSWKLFGNGVTPETAGVKSDHFVGDYYVLFEQKFQEEYGNWQESPAGQAILAKHKGPDQDDKAFFKGFKDTYFNEYSELGAAARDMLRKWEAGDAETIRLWKMMNGWVYAGFEQTYRNLGVAFDKLYYESDTYLLGKDTVEKGLGDGIFYRQDDGSVWIDLEDVKLDKKLVLRRDGTSVYITQDIGTAQWRYRDFGVERMIYVVADEQNYHFQVLFEIMKRLGEPYAAGLHHLSYGMVDLPTGRMKSREGTVVDADDLIDEVVGEARLNSSERGTLADLSAEEQEEIVRKIGLAALKYFIIKVHPKKRMIFDPKESVDLQGQTGPYVQNAYVRIQSILRRAESDADMALARQYSALETAEKDLIAAVFQFPEVIRLAAEEYDPSTIANYCYDLAKAFHRYYHDYSILRADTPEAQAFRLKLCAAIGNVLRNGMDLLGIEMPEKM